MTSQASSSHVAITREDVQAFRNATRSKLDELTKRSIELTDDVAALTKSIHTMEREMSTLRDHLREADDVLHNMRESERSASALLASAKRSRGDHATTTTSQVFTVPATLPRLSLAQATAAAPTQDEFTTPPPSPSRTEAARYARGPPPVLRPGHRHHDNDEITPRQPDTDSSDSSDDDGDVMAEADRLLGIGRHRRRNGHRNGRLPPRRRDDQRVDDDDDDVEELPSRLSWTPAAFETDFRECNGSLDADGAVCDALADQRRSNVAYDNEDQVRVILSDLATCRRAYVPRAVFENAAGDFRALSFICRHCLRLPDSKGSIEWAITRDARLFIRVGDEHMLWQHRQHQFAPL